MREEEKTIQPRLKYILIIQREKKKNGYIIYSYKSLYKNEILADNGTMFMIMKKFCKEQLYGYLEAAWNQVMWNEYRKSVLAERIRSNSLNVQESRTPRHTAKVVSSMKQKLEEKRKKKRKSLRRQREKETKIVTLS